MCRSSDNWPLIWPWHGWVNCTSYVVFWWIMAWFLKNYLCPLVKQLMANDFSLHTFASVTLFFLLHAFFTEPKRANSMWNWLQVDMPSSGLPLYPGGGIVCLVINLQYFNFSIKKCLKNGDLVIDHNVNCLLYINHTMIKNSRRSLAVRNGQLAFQQEPYMSFRWQHCGVNNIYWLVQKLDVM